MKNLMVLIVFLLMFTSGCKTTKNMEELPKMMNSALTNSYWQLSILNGNVVQTVKVQKPYLKFSANGMVSGNAGCNTFNGNYANDAENQLMFDQLKRTKMSCPDLAVENQFVSSLENVAAYSISLDTLILLNGSGIPVTKLISVADVKK